MLRNKVLWLWLAVILGAIFFSLLSHSTDDAPKTIPFSQMLSKVKTVEGDNNKLTITGDKWLLESGEDKFASQGVITDGIFTDLMGQKNGLIVDLKRDDRGAGWGSILIALIPTFLILFLFYVVWRAMGNMGNAKTPGQSMTESKARVFPPGANKTRFEDVAGCDEAKEELEEVVGFLRDPRFFTRLGGKLPKGILLTGKPGTGKTLLARAVAGEAGVPFLVISGSDFVEMYVGVGAARVRALFAQARKIAPCIIFIDELDALAKKRAMKLGGTNDEKEQTLNQLLVEMDGFESDSGIILMAATNRKDVLDEAVLRPGRFDRIVPVPLPDANGRYEILDVHADNFIVSDDVDLEDIAMSCVGFSGAELANMLNEAAIHAAVSGAELIEDKHLDYARDKVLLGKPRKSMKLSQEQYRATAVHEAGHAVVAQFTKGSDPLHKVTIVPREKALGLTVQLPKEDRYSSTKQDALGRIDVLLGGYVAEAMVFGENQTSTGVSNDLERARTIAENMVKKYGMTSGGPVAYREDDGYSKIKYSEATESHIDELVSEILTESHQRVRNTLVLNRLHLDMLTDLLLAYKTLDKQELEQLFEGTSDQ